MRVMWSIATPRRPPSFQNAEYAPSLTGLYVITNRLFIQFHPTLLRTVAVYDHAVPFLGNRRGSPSTAETSSD
jgi:hypothetical protein